MLTPTIFFHFSFWVHCSQSIFVNVHVMSIGSHWLYSRSCEGKHQKSLIAMFMEDAFLSMMRRITTECPHGLQSVSLIRFGFRSGWQLMAFHVVSVRIVCPLTHTHILSWIVMFYFLNTWNDMNILAISFLSDGFSLSKIDHWSYAVVLSLLETVPRKVLLVYWWLCLSVELHSNTAISSVETATLISCVNKSLWHRMESQLSLVKSNWSNNMMCYEGEESCVCV